MHPMFVQLYLEPDATEDDRDRRRRAARTRSVQRQRSRATLRVTAKGRDPRAATRAR
jgi:hypothetical protein